jgi:hypothetical protein
MEKSEKHIMEEEKSEKQLIERMSNDINSIRKTIELAAYIFAGSIGLAIFLYVIFSN